jgi:rSAM/selenodomain-associated transferase 1
MNPMKLDCIVIQFARLPELGKVKTRLHPELGEVGCLVLHRELVAHVHNRVKNSGLFHVLALDAMGSEDLINQLARNTPVIVQHGDDLGARMHNAIEWGLTQANKVIIIGSDCVVLNESHYQQVSQQLNNNSHVLIPAEDGGYVLVAATESFKSMFMDINWGTSEVMEKTKQALVAGNKKAAFLPLLWDVDVSEDYHRLLKTYPNWPDQSC